MLNNTWLAEVQRRLSLPENKNKKVLVHYKRHPEKITLQIKDEGNGFDWHNYMEIQSDRVTHNHGRGIALAKMMSFDDIQYRGNGNELVCTVLL
jgi:anti-sigma regulatory factor (Ser/Thr protein kinase)